MEGQLQEKTRIRNNAENTGEDTERGRRASPHTLQRPHAHHASRSSSVVSYREDGEGETTRRRGGGERRRRRESEKDSAADVKSFVGWLASGLTSADWEGFFKNGS